MINLKNLKILFVLPEYLPHSGGGISTYYQHHLAEFKNHVCEIKVIVGSGYTQEDNSFNIDGIIVEYLKPDLYQKYLNKFKKFDLFPDFKRNLCASWAMWEQTNQGAGYDIVESTDFGLGFIPWICRKNKPVVVRLHGSSGQIYLKEPQLFGTLTGDLYRQAELTLLGYSDLLVTHSVANKEYWENVIKNSKVEMIYPIYSVDESPITDLQNRTNKGIVCGRIQHWKGPELLCKSLLESSLTNIEIEWFGKDTQYDDQISMSSFLEQKYSSIWNKKIVPRPALPNHSIKEKQKLAKFAVVPSTWDMFNFTLLEYMSQGTPVICSTGAGASTLIEDGANGFLFKVDNSADLAYKIELISNLTPTSFIEMVSKARETIKQELSPAGQAIKNGMLYKQLLDNIPNQLKNNFTTSMFEPNDTTENPLKVLYNVPIKDITKHLFERLKGKLTNNE